MQAVFLYRLLLFIQNLHIHCNELFEFKILQSISATDFWNSKAWPTALKTNQWIKLINKNGGRGLKYFEFYTVDHKISNKDSATATNSPASLAVVPKYPRKEWSNCTTSFDTRWNVKTIFYTARTLAGRLCVYITDAWCWNTVRVEKLCFPDVDL